MAIDQNSILKKVMKNKPNVNSRGLYNFVVNTNLGTYPYTDDKFVDKDLYSINEGYNVNEAILGVNETIQMKNDSHFTIDQLEISHTGVNGDERNVKFKVWVCDSDSVYEEYTNEWPTYSTLLSEISATDTLIYYANYGNENAGWAPGSLINGGKIFTDLFSGIDEAKYNTDFNGLVAEDINTEAFFGSPEAGVSASPDLSWLQGTLAANSEDEIAIDADKKIYVVVWMQGDSKRWWGTDTREKRIQVFSIPVNDIILSNEEVTFDFDYGDSVASDTGDGGSGSGEAPHFRCSKLIVRASRILNEDLDAAEYGEELQNYVESGKLDFPIYISNDNPINIINARPNRTVVWENTNLNSSNKDFNFYPISFAKVIMDSVDDMDTQSYYTDNDDRFKSSSPTTIDLSFNIGNYLSSGEVIETIYEANDYESKMKFKFFILDWNDEKNKFDNWVSVFSHWVSDVDNLLSNQEKNIYKFGEIEYDGTTKKFKTTKSLKNTYISPGLKSIKLILFSCADDVDGVRFQAIRWKFINIRLYLDNAKALLEDFSDIGGADFVTLPWPKTSPVISGISQDSQYVNSLKNVLSSGKISEVDILDSSILIRARDNNELGDYLGDSDFQQLRTFNKPYSMAELLMITGSTTTTNLNSHTDTVYWDGETNTFPTESCVGTIFINDSMDPNLRGSCILEINPQELEGDIIMDSAGNGNRGLLIGDYRIDKPAKNIPIRRKSEPKISETDSENGAI